VCGSKIQTLNNPPVPDQDSILGAKVICVKDTLTVNAGSVDNYQNSYSQVPGPLPVLGASLVLGSVRKLRNLTSRLKVHSMG
jgi:hypothetical protein